MRGTAQQLSESLIQVSLRKKKDDMSQTTLNPFDLTSYELQQLIENGKPNLPELDSARAERETFSRSPRVQLFLEQTANNMENIEQIPQTMYTHYRLFWRTGDRINYENPYFLKRARMGSIALRVFLGQKDLKDTLQDYIWNICEETNWVLPAHEACNVDLFSAETGFMLAETLALLGDELDAEVRTRVRLEIERRVFDPYLRWHQAQFWYQRMNNWNGVCNSSVAATFLLLEVETGRLARALEIALAGLKTFINKAFEEDGSSTEGVAYWHYGLMNLVAFAEMLRVRTSGAVDILALPKMRQIAAYPAKMFLSGSDFTPFSDCDESVQFNPGILARMAERTGEKSLLSLLVRNPEEDWRLPMMLRNLLWWDGQYGKGNLAPDTYLPAAGIARLVSHTQTGAPVILVVKAGHNAENHNQNDVGSFVLHIGEETFLADPGAGLYTRQYFNEQRYLNIFASSYGHSVPRIRGKHQQAGLDFHGEILEFESEQAVKRIELEFARAYPLENLQSLRRVMQLDGSGMLRLNDSFHFSADPVAVEEALVTWLDVKVEGDTAWIQGQHHTLRLTLETPTGLAWQVENLEQQCKANQKPGILKRLTVNPPTGNDLQVQVKIEVM
jgi:hypothetical protein